MLTGDILAGDAEVQRQSVARGWGGALVAPANCPQIETVDSVSALYLGRKVHNLLDVGYAPFDAVPAAWGPASALSLAATGLSFGAGSMRIDPATAPVIFRFRNHA